MRVLFVNRFYWPETPATGQLLTDLAEGLVARGISVEVLTSRSDTTSPAHEDHAGVRIHRVRGTRWARRMGVLGKAADFGTFFVLALWQTFRLARRDCVVVAMTDPPLLGIGLSFVTRARGARFVQWVQDIYPEIAIALAPARFLRALIPVRNHAWRDADACVTLGEDMADRLLEAGVPSQRIAIIPNWALEGTSQVPTAEIAALRRAWNLEDKFILLYSGNLGRVHDLEAVLDLAATLRDESNMACVFVGDGAQREALVESARTRGLTNVVFHPPQPRAKLAVTLALADLQLVTLRADCAGLVFPSKLYGAAAAARAVVFIGPLESDVARLVAEAGMGLTASRETIGQLGEGIRQLAGETAARALCARRAAEFARLHDRSAAVEAWSRLLAALQTDRTAARVRCAHP